MAISIDQMRKIANGGLAAETERESVPKISLEMMGAIAGGTYGQEKKNAVSGPQIGPLQTLDSMRQTMMQNSIKDGIKSGAALTEKIDPVQAAAQKDADELSALRAKYETPDNLSMSMQIPEGKKANITDIPDIDADKRRIETLNNRAQMSESEQKLQYTKDAIFAKNKQKQEQMTSDIQNIYNNSGIVGKSIINAATVPLNTFGALDSAAQLAENIKSGEYSPYRNGFIGMQEMAQVIRGEASANIAQGIADLGGGQIAQQLASVAYQAAMSAADSAFGAATMGHAYTGGMGIGAANQRAKELYEQGADGKTIVLGSILSGAAEAAFEYVSLDQLVHPERFKTAFARILGQAGIEASEEIATDIANIVSDAATRKDNDSERAISEYKESGMTDEQATRAYLRDVLQNEIWTALSAGISGGLSGTGSSAVYSIMQRQAIESIGREYIGNTEELEELVEAGKNAARTTEAYKLAQNVQDAMNGNKSPSAYTVGSMVTALSDQKTSTATMIQNVVEKSGVALGVSENVYKQTADVASRFSVPVLYVPRESMAITKNIINESGDIIGQKVVGYADGLYDDKTGMIKVSNVASPTMTQMAVLGHELTHAIEGTEEYGRVVELAKKLDPEFEQRAQQMIINRSGTSAEVDYDGAVRELVANFIGKQIFNDGVPAQIVNYAPGFGQTVMDALRGVRDTIKSDNIAKAERAFRNALEAVKTERNTDYSQNGEEYKVTNKKENRLNEKTINRIIDEVINRKSDEDNSDTITLGDDSRMEKDNIESGNRAIDELISKKDETDDPSDNIVKNAMYRSGIGYIDFVWGKSGTGNKFKHGYGLAHIIAKRNADGYSGVDIARAIVDVIAKSTDAEIQSNDFTSPDFSRLKLHYNGYTAVLQKNGNNSKWLLSGWVDNKTTAAYETGAVRDATSSTADGPIRTRPDGVNATDVTSSIRLKASESQEKYSASFLDGQEVDAEDVPSTAKERQFAQKRTLREDANTGLLEDIAQEFEQNPEMYSPVGNKETLEKAKEKLRDPKYAEKLRKRVMRFDPNDKLSSGDVAAAIVMINDAKNDGNLEKAVELIRGLSRKGTEAGRAVQAYSMMARMTPEGTLKAAIKTMNKVVDQIKGDGYSDGMDDAAQKISDEIQREIDNGADDYYKIVLNVLKNVNKIKMDERIQRAIESLVEAANLEESLQKGDGKKPGRDPFAGNGWSFDDFLADLEYTGLIGQEATRRLLDNLLGIPSLSNDDVAKILEYGSIMQENDIDSDEFKKAYEDCANLLATRIPNTLWDNLTSWRKFGMLFNVKTHMRNFLSNWAYWGVRQGDKAVADIISRIMKVNPDERAALFGWSMTEKGKAIKNIVEKESAEAAKNLGKDTGRYNFGEDIINQRRDYFRVGKNEKSWWNQHPAKQISKLNEWNSQMLEKEDAIAYRVAYKDALGQYMVIHDMTDVTNDARNYADMQALEATFRTKNSINEVISGLKQSKLIGKPMDILIPFSKTPANIAEQTFWHSPIGIAYGAYSLVNASKGKNGKQMATAINTMAKGVTGTALMAIGVLLGGLGLFNTKYGKTEKERAADELAGIQENAFLFGNVSISADWLQPSAAPFIMGASIAQRIIEDGLSLSSVFGAVMDGTDSLFELTMLQSLYDAFGGYDKGVTATMISVVESLISQSIPTLVGQAARAIDPVQRKTSGDNIFTESLGQEFGKFVSKVAVKIPGMTYLLEPELDVWGEDVYRTGKNSTGSGILNFLQQFAIPTNVKIATQTDETTKKLLELYNGREDKRTYALPSSINREEAKELGLDYIEAQRFAGSKELQYVREFMQNKTRYSVQRKRNNGKTYTVNLLYKDMNDDERLRVISRIYKNVKDEILDENEKSEYYEEVLRRSKK